MIKVIGVEGWGQDVFWRHNQCDCPQMSCVGWMREKVEDAPRSGAGWLDAWKCCVPCRRDLWGSSVGKQFCFDTSIRCTFRCHFRVIEDVWSPGEKSDAPCIWTAPPNTGHSEVDKLGLRFPASSTSQRLTSQCKDLEEAYVVSLVCPPEGLLLPQCSSHFHRRKFQDRGHGFQGSGMGHPMASWKKFQLTLPAGLLCYLHSSFLNLWWNNNSKYSQEPDAVLSTWIYHPINPHNPMWKELLLSGFLRHREGMQYVTNRLGCPPILLIPMRSPFLGPATYPSPPPPVTAWPRLGEPHFSVWPLKHLEHPPWICQTKYDWGSSKYRKRRPHGSLYCLELITWMNQYKSSPLTVSALLDHISFWVSP